MLLDGRSGHGFSKLLDIGRNQNRLDAGKGSDALTVASLADLGYGQHG